ARGGTIAFSLTWWAVVAVLVPARRVNSLYPLPRGDIDISCCTPGPKVEARGRMRTAVETRAR
ncbi:unnamed protein product, partial [marine sediment metagenome]